jgi:hypothetical protein
MPARAAGGAAAARRPHARAPSTPPRPMHRPRNPSHPRSDGGDSAVLQLLHRQREGGRVETCGAGHLRAVPRGAASREAHGVVGWPAGALRGLHAGGAPLVTIPWSLRPRTPRPQGWAFYWGTSEWSAQQIQEVGGPRPGAPPGLRPAAFKSTPRHIPAKLGRRVWARLWALTQAPAPTPPTQAWDVAERLDLIGPCCEQPQFNVRRLGGEGQGPWGVPTHCWFLEHSAHTPTSSPAERLSLNPCYPRRRARSCLSAARWRPSSCRSTPGGLGRARAVPLIGGSRT